MNARTRGLGQMRTHLRRPAGPCSCDRSTGAPSRARDRSAYCRFRSRGCFGVVSRTSRRWRAERTQVRDAQKEERTKKRLEGREEDATGRRVRLAGNVARVVSGAVAGRRLACTLRRDVRRRSISDHPATPDPLLPFVPAVRHPRATNPAYRQPKAAYLPDDKLPFQLATPTYDRHRRQLSEGCYDLYGVSREKGGRRGSADLVSGAWGRRDGARDGRLDDGGTIKVGN